MKTTGRRPLPRDLGAFRHELLDAGRRAGPAARELDAVWGSISAAVLGAAGNAELVGRPVAGSAAGQQAMSSAQGAAKVAGAGKVAGAVTPFATAKLVSVILASVTLAAGAASLVASNLQPEGGSKDVLPVVGTPAATSGAPQASIRATPPANPTPTPAAATTADSAPAATPATSATPITTATPGATPPARPPATAGPLPTAGPPSTAGERLRAAPDLGGASRSAEPDASSEPTRAGAGAPPAQTTLASEAAVVLQARRALQDSAPEAALTVLRDAERGFGPGALGQEREALFIQALARSGQRAEASERATRYLQRYPASPHSRAVRSIVEP